MNTMNIKLQPPDIVFVPSCHQKNEYTIDLCSDPKTYKKAIERYKMIFKKDIEDIPNKTKVPIDKYRFLDTIRASKNETNSIVPIHIYRDEIELKENLERLYEHEHPLICYGKMKKQNTCEYHHLFISMRKTNFLLKTPNVEYYLFQYWKSSKNSHHNLFTWIFKNIYDLYDILKEWEDKTPEPSAPPLAIPVFESNRCIQPKNEYQITTWTGANR